MILYIPAMVVKPAQTNLSNFRRIKDQYVKEPLLFKLRGVKNGPLTYLLRAPVYHRGISRLNSGELVKMTSV